MDQFRQLSNIYKKEFSDYSFKIRRLKMRDGDAGDCECTNKVKNEFYIRINNKTKKDEQLLWLLHEIAHALSWHSKGKDDHNADFGKAYAKCYRIYLEKFVEEKND